jgi:hypothetical protein
VFQSTEIEQIEYGSVNGNATINTKKAATARYDADPHRELPEATLVDSPLPVTQQRATIDMPDGVRRSSRKH